MAFEKGVRYYTTGTLAVHFPEDKVCCGYCPLAYRLDRDTSKCPFTGQLNFTPALSVQEGCPLKFEGGENEQRV